MDDSQLKESSFVCHQMGIDPRCQYRLVAGIRSGKVFACADDLIWNSSGVHLYVKNLSVHLRIGPYASRLEEVV